MSGNDLNGAGLTERGYVLATPARNEIAALPGLIATMEAQREKPLVWLIVDDGSDDGSREWLTRESLRLGWLSVVPAPEAADEYLGAHIARLKRFGLERAIAIAHARGQHPACAGILDADVELPENHYQTLMAAMAQSPRLGVASSMLWAREGERLFIEPFQRADLPRGPTQFFRLECLDAIGGLPPWPSFDSIANVKARALGYEARLLTDLAAIHTRETASRHGHAEGYARKGVYAWFLGLHPLLVVARTLAYSARRPRRAGYHFLKGYLMSALQRSTRCPDPVVRRHYGLPRVLEVTKAAVGLGPSYVSAASAARPDVSVKTGADTRSALQ